MLEIEKIKKARQTIEKSNDAQSVLILILLQRVVLLSDEKALKIKYCIEIPGI